jgi:hypothetical protein
MPLKSQTLPNRRLTGAELMTILEKRFHEMLARDYAFTPNVAYGRVAVNITLTMHIAGVTSEHVVRSYTKADGVVEGEPPLAEPVEEDAALIALTRDFKMDNPNLERVAAGLPIVFQQRAPQAPPQDYTPPLPGEPPPDAIIKPYDVETVEVRYDPTQYPKPADPVDRDVSAEKARELGVPQHVRKGAMMKERRG